MSKLIHPGARIGIIGAGQLGKMLAQSAQKMGYKVAMYDPNPSSCGFAVAHSKTVADFSDREQLMAFVQSVDVVTYEFENIDGELLQELANVGYLPQGTQLLLTTQDRLKEKAWLKSIDVKTVDYSPVSSLADIDINQPSLLKTNRLGYDGKGQFLLKASDAFAELETEIEALLNEHTMIQEAFCDFEYEVSVIVARDTAGKISVFPPSINQHVNGVLFTSDVNSAFDKELTDKINQIANKIAEAGALVGVCGIEFFVTADGQILVNELAPRPHNSGHYTIEACNVSQYDQHILAITGRSLMGIRLLENSLMVNILGQHMGQLDEVMALYPDAMLHIYDKGEVKTQRKMGHFTFCACDSQSLLNSDFLQSWRQQF